MDYQGKYYLIIYIIIIIIFKGMSSSTYPKLLDCNRLGREDINSYTLLAFIIMDYTIPDLTGTIHQIIIILICIKKVISYIIIPLVHPFLVLMDDEVKYLADLVLCTSKGA